MQNGLLHVKGNLAPVVLDDPHDLLPLFVGLELFYFGSDCLVFELGRNIGHVAHHAARLKGVPVEVHKDFVERVGAVVGVLNAHFAL